MKFIGKALILSLFLISPCFGSQAIFESTAQANHTGLVRILEGKKNQKGCCKNSKFRNFKEGKGTRWKFS